KRGAFPRRPANWPELPGRLDEPTWAADVALLRDEHARLVESASAVDPALLSRRPPTSRRWTYGELVLGIAMHDAYHTGQIQLLKRLWQER
ncbi:MAG: DinB family protein, partial [Gemmatimonadales bacterium]